jgi:acyl carrier protein
MNTQTSSIEDRVKAILAAQFCKEVAEIDLQADLEKQYQCDSLDLVEIVMLCEDEFDIEIDDDTMFAIETGEQLVLTVMERV